MFGVRAFLPPNLHQIVPQDPGQTECIWSPICLLQKCPHHSVVIQKIFKGGFSIWRIQAHNFQVSRKLPIGSRISVLLQNIPPFSKGGQRWQHWAAKQLINFLPSSNSRPRYLIYEYRWRVSAGICQNTHLTLRR